MVACIGFQIMRAMKVITKRFLHVKNQSFKNINKKGLCFKPLTVAFQTANYT